jgi:hypothetical protein
MTDDPVLEDIERERRRRRTEALMMASLPPSQYIVRLGSVPLGMSSKKRVLALSKGNRGNRGWVSFAEDTSYKQEGGASYDQSKFLEMVLAMPISDPERSEAEWWDEVS